MTEILQALEESFRAIGEQRREQVRVPGFDVFVDAHSDAYHLSFAVPIAGDAPWDEAVPAMRAAFEARGRRARLEYFEELHSDLAAVLTALGFQRDMSAPVLTLSAEDLAAPPQNVQGSYRTLTPERAGLEDFLRRQSLAYEGNGDDDALIWLDSMTAGLRAGKLLAAGLEVEGELVAGASVQIGGSVGELAGVWTLPEKQKRGFAFELCQRLLQDYFAAGSELCWLSAAEGALRLYQKLGFREVGTQLNYGVPEA